MDTPTKSIGPMDKVHLNIKAVPPLGNEAAEPVETHAALIYGIGTSGVTPFEKMLHTKSAGDQFSLPIEPGVDTVIFGHLQCIVAHAIRMAPPYTLHITVASVAPAAPQEVVRAMAQSTGCGGGCDCGCGGH
ncbi:MAG: hypothetical protein WAU91_21065 [Desulfatitalea sp.]